ncbi:MAG TPA: glycosyltransferase N-terminal domain-containing protein, partial [Saprospiraceae bacterium]|nr:glycosyltransferase N-terminal domain-containing protein [Saprospiraceae bacterium]
MPNPKTELHFRDAPYLCPMYFLITQIYYGLIRLAAFWNPKARLAISGRAAQKAAFEKSDFSGGRWIWVHCASLGEFEQGRPLIEAIKKELPDYKILLTFFSPSGYEVRKNYAFADRIFYLPFD